MEQQKKNIEYKDFTGNDVKPLVSRSLDELKELQKFCSAKMARYIDSPFYRERWHRHWYRIDMMMKDIESIPEDCH